MATTISTSRQIKLATRLPDRLLRFFARWPPQQFAESSTSTPNTILPSTISAPTEASANDAVSSSPTPSSISLADPQPPSPFKAWKHPITGNWHDPVFSLRRQAELVKLARQHGVEELLPHTTKGTMEKIRKREENGIRVKGTGVGQQVKGKKWERTMKGRLEKRREAMLAMPKMIQEWKQRGHGRGNKKWPK